MRRLSAALLVLILVGCEVVPKTLAVRAPERTVVLMIESKGIVPTGD